MVLLVNCWFWGFLGSRYGGVCGLVSDFSASVEVVEGDELTMAEFSI